MKRQALFIDDITVQGSYFAVTIRSPVAGGRLIDINPPSMPSSYTLIRAETIPGDKQLPDFPVPVLASQNLSYIGEPVAVLVGPQEGRLRDYASRCRVIAEEKTPEPALFLERVIADNTGAADRPGPETAGPPDGEGCTAQTEKTEKIEKIEKIEKKIRGAYATGIQEHWYADPHGAVAAYSPEEARITVYTASQWVFHVRRSVARVLGIPDKTVLVQPAWIGLHLDGKIWYPSLVACHAALGAFIAKKPVKLILTKEEDFRYSPKRNAASIEITSALGSRGEAVETAVTASVDLGAQGIFAEEILDRTCLGCLGAYHLGRVRLEAKAAGTAIPPQGPLSGFGLSQGFFALERQVSRIADSLGQDPAEWRKRNLRRGGDLAIGVPLETPPLEDIINEAARGADYYRKWSAYELLRQCRRDSLWKERDEPIRGIGIAAAYQGSGFLYSYNRADEGVYTVEAALDRDGFLEIKASVISANYSHIRMWREMASEILALEGELIRINLGNTDTAPDSGPGTNSRNIGAITRLVEGACRALQKERLKAEPPLAVRQSSSPLWKIPWEGKTPGPCGGRRFDQQALADLAWGAAAVEVEIDPVSYTPRIRGVWLAVDCGRVLAEERARLTLIQSTIHALGWASREELYYTGGVIPDPLFYTYDIPPPSDIPPIRVSFIKRESSRAKGIEELPFSTVPAAYIQSVSQALDHPFEAIPLHARAIWETGKLARQEPV
ncbi:MAG: xanthine dehydrogenase family protein molybdopterin-binding subunit [Spirochaetaceae bacterium]|jgi:CO/xanthine dehydrogenase Mo-binding subunit|nr:xanthine dehydrogenase family protein molybdopterin-binding subunit [Spirochaetaceae bacterium]